ncbi:MAG: T9SS type A sorting domain-containing protein [Bacteroidota bacterium]
MMRRIPILLSVCILVFSTVFAGRDLKNAKPATLIADDGVGRAVSSTQNGQYIPGLDNASSLTWVVVDSMPNAFGPASTRTRPIVYDAATNTLAIIYRGASPFSVSGQLWYSISRDGGATWRRVGELNSGSPTTCRYPSAGISNPANNNDTTQTLFVWMAPNLESAGTWGNYSYGLDFPLGSATTVGIHDLTDMGNNSAAGSIWGEYNSDWVLWNSTVGTTAGGANDSRSWRTQDWLSIPTQIPPTWVDAAPYIFNAISYVPGMSNATGNYFGMHGVFGDDSLAFAFNIGYSKSTDHGATWSEWVRPQPDWMAATGLPQTYDLYDYVQPPGTTVSYNGDMTIDANGHGHFFHVIVDSPWTTNDPRHILEVYETAPNVWSNKWVKQNLNTFTGLGYPGATGNPPTPYLQQTNNAVHASISADGQVMSLVWLDAGTTAPADSFPDIWLSHRLVNGGNWSTPVNLTETPNFAELLLHAAPVLQTNGEGLYTVFLGRTYQANINTYPPDNGVKAQFFFASYTFNATALSVGENGQPLSFKLGQNYPNPFNPSTTITYSVAQQERVSLKVFNTLGQQVATLVDGVVSPGEYQTSFDATGLPTGVYIYKMTAGTRTESRKMLLVK